MKEINNANICEAVHGILIHELDVSFRVYFQSTLVDAFTTGEVHLHDTEKLIYTLAYHGFIDADFKDDILLWHNSTQYNAYISAMIQYIFTGGV